MTTFAGSISASPIYAASSGLNPYLDANSIINSYPYGGRLTSSASFGIISRGTVAVTHWANAGAISNSFVNDWYYRIHLDPTLLALGNVVSSVVNTVSVWNAWLTTPQTLTAINGGGTTDGITLVGPSVPGTFPPNAAATWTASVSTDGPPTIDAFYTWQFANGESQTLEITGSRITAWALTPDWSGGVRERLAFLTNVLAGWSGAEQRRSLRLAPRRTFDFSCLMSRQERRLIENALFDWSARVFALPIWPDGQRITSAAAAGASAVSCDPANRDFTVGGLAILISSASSYEIVQVASINAGSIGTAHPLQGSWSSGTRFYPARSARLASFPTITRENSQVATIAPTFTIVEPCDWPVATGLPTYRGLPVLENRPNEAEGSPSVYAHLVNQIDNETGVYVVDDTADMGFPAWSHVWWMQGRTQRVALRALLYLLRGRQGEIWVPTYQSDFELMATVASSATTMDVEACGYSLYAAGQQNREDIRIETTSGQIFYRRVTGSVDVGGGIERISIDSSLGTTLAPSAIRAISYLVHCRLDSDEIEIDHAAMADGLASATTPWRAVNHDI